MAHWGRDLRLGRHWLWGAKLLRDLRRAVRSRYLRLHLHHIRVHGAILLVCARECQQHVRCIADLAVLGGHWHWRHVQVAFGGQHGCHLRGVRDSIHLLCHQPRVLRLRHPWSAPICTAQRHSAMPPHDHASRQPGAFDHALLLLHCWSPQ